MIVFAVIALTAPRPAQANFKNNIIFSGCAAAMRKEYQQANKQLLLSQLNKTCDYVVKQINNRKILNKPKLLASI
ncbi:putative conserved secreted protein [Synechococcus sp. MIT S9220]|nr:putative conserved secreted protein [Synechococcus sp. MIT S9220]